MPLAEYNRSRPASALGTNYGTNGGTSSWKTSVAGPHKAAAPAQSRPTQDVEYDSDDLDFEAYKKTRFPNAAADSTQGRSTSALGMTSTGEYSSNEALSATGNGSDNAARSKASGSVANINSSAISTGTSATVGPRRLQNMLHSLNARSTINPPSRTPGLTSRMKNMQGTAKTTPPHAEPPPKPASPAPPEERAYSTSSRTTIRPNSSPKSRPALLHSTSATSQPRAAGSPDPDASSSDSGISYDQGSFENGIAARKHYRVLEAQLDVLRDAYRKDPNNYGLSDYDLNQGAKSIELEDPDEQALYKELRDYVVRDGKLGPNWDKYRVGREAEIDAVDNEEFQDDEDDDLDMRDILKEPEVEGEDSGAQTKYHDALDQPHVETVDLASFERPPRRSHSKERPGHTRVRSITTTDLPTGNGPLSAGSSSAGTRPLARPPSPPEERHALPSLVRSSSATGNRLPPSSSSQYHSEYKQSYTTHPQDPYQQPLPEDEEEEAPVHGGGKFESMALNDTLQLRQQRTPWSTLPPDAIVYEPPPPPARSARKRISPPDLATTTMKASSTARTADRGRQNPLRSTAQQPAAAAAAAPAARDQRYGSSQTIHAQPMAQSQAHQQRLTKSAGKRRVEERDRDYGAGSGAEERRPAATSRPNSSRGMRGEEERGDSGAEMGGGYGYGGSMGRAAPQQQQQQQQPGPYQDQWIQQPQQQQNYYGNNMYDPNAHMRASHPMPMPANGNQYYGGANGMYGQGQNSSPIERGTLGDRTPGPMKDGLARANTLPNNAITNNGNSLIGPDAQKHLMTVNKHQYLRLEQIGRGGSSKVYRVVRMRDWKQFALKKVVLSAVDDEAIRSYATEIQMLKRLSGNDAIVRLIDDELKGKGSGSILLVMELGETDFSKLLVERQGTPISLPWITLYFKQMLEAVNVIHEERIVHSDLKPANFVLIRSTLKLIDFGIAKAIANDTTNIQRDSQMGTLNYMSPETMNAAPGDDRLKIGRPSDVWSLGCILYQMVYGSAPFAALSFQQKMIAIARQEHIIDYPEYSVPILPKEKSGTGRPEPREDLKVRVPRELVETMQRCLTREAKKRPTIAQLLKERWLEGLYTARDAPTAPSVPAATPVLGKDEALISTHYMLQLIDYCYKTYDPSWDGDSANNRQKVEEMAEQIMDQLKQVPRSHE